MGKISIVQRNGHRIIEHDGDPHDDELISRLRILIAQIEDEQEDD